MSQPGEVLIVSIGESVWKRITSFNERRSKRHLELIETGRRKTTFLYIFG